ncbi:kinesin-like protein KIN-7O isoform X2 [Sesamum indicum]|uniref:Kinesin-like protein KIN-7O isoform X2 n=1 Tax=Sesamum indicum TaxID=4182 RepID=A0A6I9T4X0_SESIN|nr:kinesin-like protein KIN-7O isoform X2 [Sesamum indicum]
MPRPVHGVFLEILFSYPTNPPNLNSIFGEDCKTQDVYRARTRDIVAAAVRGFNGTVFAYGQTSSGKTHTMRGSKSELGVIPLAVHDLFNIIQQEMDREFLLRMSYMEIYNEEINDLLAPEHRKLQIHESIERGIFVAGLREEIVASADQVLELMEFGESHRHIGETNMNVYSSRSHTIFRMIIESREKTDDAETEFSCDAVRVSVLNLVDLAGSERAAKTGAEGVRLKEGSHINKSLMTLGTVIKKLSEGAESQGGHVPYRDSKLTRILQPALGGNANTAIICNITLAQIHADETKSSLQFASRALRVTNCAHVNEILTDAALLKRQKKEIEELRAKLQGLHSEHLEEEILNLRNTLLKSELERERMALELEEEKKAQAEREKRLQEQAKKIENLSSMVFCANREETSVVYKKAKRRDTWCPGNLLRKKLKELSSVVKETPSEVKSTRADCTIGPLLPFEELVKEASAAELCKQEQDCKRSASEDCTLPDPNALLHVTSRRKVPARTRSLPMESNDLTEMQAEYENLLSEFETYRTMSDIQIDYLTRKLAEADLVVDEKCRECTARNPNPLSHPDGNRSLKDSDAILVIKQLQEKIAILEMEKSSSQQNLDCVFDLATERTKSAQEKYEKMYEELMLAQEEATLARDTLASVQSSVEESDWMTSLLTEAQEIKLEFDNSRHLIGSLSSVVDELVHFSSTLPNLILDLRPSAAQSMVQIESIFRSHEMIHSCLRSKVRELEEDKLVLCNQASELHCRIEELNLKVQNSTNAFMELEGRHEAEKSEYLCQLQMLQRENSSLSSCSLAKEKESIRKDLEKTKLKLKDMEFKLKNAIQERTKLEGEKSCAERELKRLQSQKAMLERDMSKRESIIGRRRDSTIDRSSNVFDQKQTKGSTALAELEEEYKKLEVVAFEMETVIGALEDQLAIANGEKDAATSRAESLASDLQVLSNELHLSNSELTLKEEVVNLRTSLEEYRSHVQEMESSLKTLTEEKEDLSMQLTEALLTMEEEKAIWSSKEKASVEFIGEKDKLYAAEIASLSEKLSQARNELEIYRRDCIVSEELPRRSEENGALEKQCRCFKEKPSEVNLSRNEERASDDQSKRSPEILNLRPDSKCQNTCEEIEILQLELGVLRKERAYLLAQVQELEPVQLSSTDDSQILKLKHELEQQSDRLSSMEDKMRNDQVSNSKDKAKLRMRLRGAQSKLDTFRVRYHESVDELEYMNRKFEEASSKLKKQLASYGTEVLNLKKQLAAVKGQ